jgi:hypothetical protein
MYCTLQEAYNIPAVDPIVRRKKCMTPLRNQQLKTQQSLPILDDVSPYDLYSPNNGQQLAAADRIKYGREDFTDMSQSQSQSNRDQSGGIFSSQPPTYAAQGGDYNYYCKDYNICPKPAISAEPFTTQQTNTTPGAQCASVQAPIYEIPISAENKQNYQNAMNTAINQQPPSQPIVTSIARSSDMNKVKGYYDEDLEQYLQTNDMHAAPAINIPKPPAPLKPEETPFRIPYEKPTTPKVALRHNHKEAIEKGTTIDAILDIVLFTLVGILIILLCDQIFKAAMIYGMKETLKTMSPYLQKIQANID